METAAHSGAVLTASLARGRVQGTKRRQRGLYTSAEKATDSGVCVANRALGGRPGGPPIREFGPQTAQKLQSETWKAARFLQDTEVNSSQKRHVCNGHDGFVVRAPQQGQISTQSGKLLAGPSVNVLLANFLVWKNPMHAR